MAAEILPPADPAASAARQLDWARLVRWAVPLGLLALLLVLALGGALLHWPLPGNRFMLMVCALWVGFAVTRALYTDALVQESQKRQRLIELLDSTRRDLAEEERRAGVLPLLVALIGDREEADDLRQVGLRCRWQQSLGGERSLGVNRRALTSVHLQLGVYACTLTDVNPRGVDSD